ncbi:MAG: TIGR00730 family Rossman fold protein, partial [Gemmata sp.]
MSDRLIETTESPKLSGEWRRQTALAAPAETRFLRGPQARKFEFWQVIKICRELFRGFRKLHFVGPCVTVFGSARFDEHHRYYAMARQVGHMLGKSGFTTMTGGGPGIME